MLKNIKGITLVALVVTIVVLLILAGVSINLVLGNNGIIAKAKDAETKSAEASQNDLKGMNDLEDEMDKQLGTYDPLKSIPTKTLEEAKVDFVKEKTKVEFSDGNVIIPEGFKIADVPASKVQNGVVIEDKDGNQFVWVPVDTLSNMAVPTSGTDANRNTNYRGVLYNWNTDATGNTAYDWSADSTSYREPANSSSDSTSKNSSWTSTLYQEEYNKMIKSVSQYGGFYVGRYEMSLNSETKNAESKYGATSANAKDTDTNQWYGLYNRAKTYAPENASQKVVSSMIWGSQWDATMRWMYNSGNEEKKKYTYDSRGKGNYSSDSPIATGSIEAYAVNNIYDMAGNVNDWTIEAYGTILRDGRGGYYRNNGNSGPASIRSTNGSNEQQRRPWLSCSFIYVTQFLCM